MGYIEVKNIIYEKPLVILSEIFFGYCEGMELSLFTLYENGQIIYRKNTKNEKVNYFEVLLDNDKKNKFLNSLLFSGIYNIMEKTYENI